MNPFGYTDEENLAWVRTEVGHVWYNGITGMYTFADETYQFNGLYLTMHEARTELSYYIPYLG